MYAAMMGPTCLDPARVMGSWLHFNYQCGSTTALIPEPGKGEPSGEPCSHAGDDRAALPCCWRQPGSHTGGKNRELQLADTSKIAYCLEIKQTVVARHTLSMQLMAEMEKPI